MADIVSPETRSRMMAGIRGKNTRPEMVVRRRPVRPRLPLPAPSRTLPGKPDLVLPKYRAAVFVSGCFWHGHDCPLFRWPATNEAFWRDKIGRNMVRDVERREELVTLGWRVATVWECSLRQRSPEDVEQALDALAGWLRSDARGTYDSCGRG